MDNNLHIETLLANTPSVDGSGIAPVTGAIYQTSSFINNGKTPYSYTRCDNPTRSALEEKMRVLDGGVRAFAFASGLAAVTACFSLLQSGDEVVISNDIYGGTYRLLEQIFGHFGIRFLLTDMSSLAEVEANLSERTKMVYFETPTNPMMRVADIRRIMGISRVSAYELVHTPGFPAFRSGRLIKVSKKAFFDWMEKGTETVPKGNK